MSKFKYFAGDPNAPTLYKYVAPLKCASFREFFESQLWQPIRLAETREEFYSLPKDIQKRKKWVRYFLPSSFRECDGEGQFEKNDNNTKAVSLICLDIDPEKDKDTKEEISYPAAPLINDPEIIWQALADYNFAVYTTLNHTQDRPRIRVVVEADNLDTQTYSQCAGLIAAKLNLPFITTESKVKSQAMFRPTVFADTDTDKNPVVIAHNFKGRAVTQAEVDSFQPSDGPNPQTVPTLRRSHNVDENGMLDGLEFLRFPAENVTLENVKDLLGSIDSNCNRNLWIKVAMTMRHQFQDCDDDAFELFDKWSSKGGDSYKSREDTRYFWDHVSPQAESRLPVTIRSLYKIAREHGWDEKKQASQHFEELKEWITSCDNIGDAVDGAMERIIKTPTITPLYESALINCIKARAKKLGADMTPAELRKSLKVKKNLVRERQKAENEQVEGTPAWARGLVYISKTELLYRVATTEGITKASFDSTYGPHLLPSDQELQESGDTSRRNRFTPTIRPQDYVLNELCIPSVYDDMYDPTNPDDTIVMHEDRRYVNTYRKSYAKPEHTKAEEAGKVIKGHLALLIKEEEHQTRFIDFIAHLVQRPEKKIRWAFLIQSAQGNGKGLLAKALRGVFGHGNIKTVDPDAVFSNYNDWACGSLLTILNEIRINNHSRYDMMNKLKEPIADNHISINQKFRSNREVINVTNYLMFTNHKDALAIEERERRYFVVFSPLQTDRDTQELVESGKLKPLQNLVDSEDFGGTRAFFEEWEISKDFCPNSPPPKTEYFYQMAGLTVSDLDQTVTDILKDNDDPWVNCDILSSTMLKQKVSAELKQNVSPMQVNKALQARGYTKLGRYTIAGSRHQVWVDSDPAIMDLIQDPVKELERRIENQGEELL